MKKGILPLLFILAFSTATEAQDLKLQGQVLDTSGTKPLHQAVVMGVRLADSTLAGYARTDSKGFFDLRLPLDTYQVVLSHHNFGEKQYLIIGSENNNELNFGKVKLQMKKYELTEVVVYSETAPIYYNGDTLVFTADSFKVDDHENVEALIAKLPGMEVKSDGSIKFQGNDIDKVYVDGDEFFGSDPTVATKNLNASTVESLQVYDEKKEGDDDSDDETQKILNLKLKEDAKKGYFGKISVASDANTFHEAEGLANKYSNKRKVSVYGLYSSTPRSRFDWDDIYDYGIEDGSGNAWDPNSSNDGTGIPRTGKAGFTYSDKIGKKVKTTLAYSYSQRDLNSVSESTSQYFLPDTNYSTVNSQNTNDRSSQHYISGVWEHDLDSNHYLEIEPIIRIQEQIVSSFSTNDFVNSENVKERTTQLSNYTKHEKQNISLSGLFKKKFKKEDRSLGLRYTITSKNTNSDQRVSSQEEVFNGSPLTIDEINQMGVLKEESEEHETSLWFSEPLSKKITLTFRYGFEAFTGTNKRQVFDYQNLEYSLFNDSLSNDFKSSALKNYGGVTFSHAIKKKRFSIGGRIQSWDIDNTDLESGSTINQHIFSFLPSARFSYKFSKSVRLWSRYNTNIIKPAAQQLQPVPNNSNPNNVVLGNPDLRPSYVHRMNIYFNSWKMLTGNYSYLNAYFNYKTTDFANSTTYDSLGRAVFKTVNVSGNYDGGIRGQVQVPTLKKRLTITPSLNVSTNQRTSFVNDQENVTVTNSINPGLSLKWEDKKLTLRVGTDYTYSDPNSSINTLSALPFSNQYYFSSIRYKFTKTFIFNTSVNYTINSQRTESHNIDFLLWNASLEKLFFEKKNLILSVNATDLLNQNVSAQRTVSDNVIVDNRTQIIGRYILGKLVYKFSGTKKKKTDSDALLDTK